MLRALAVLSSLVLLAAAVPSATAGGVPEPPLWMVLLVAGVVEQCATQEVDQHVEGGDGCPTVNAFEDATACVVAELGRAAGVGEGCPP